MIYGHGRLMPGFLKAVRSSCAEPAQQSETSDWSGFDPDRRFALIEQNLGCASAVAGR
ncbi:MAG: hypothetical protein H0W71_01775 [Sphingomonas sp.]|nr:hypothetical protein [Sphingomonas sp.]